MNLTPLDYLLSTENHETMELQDLTINLFDDWKNTKILWQQSAIAIDSETTALKPNQGKLRLFQVYLPTIDQVAIIDFWSLTNDQFNWFNELLKVLADKNIIKFCQRGIFDFYWIYWLFKVIPQNVIDTMILSQIEKAGMYEGYLFDARIKAPNSLENLSNEHGFLHDKSFQSSDWSKPQLSTAQLKYAARDAVITYKIGEILLKEVMETQPLVVKAECGSIPAFVWLQYNGLVCDVHTLNDLLESYSDKAKHELKRLEKLMPYDPVYHQKVIERDNELASIAANNQKTRKAPFKDKPFNVGSASQVLIYLKNCGYSEELLKEDTTTGAKRESSGKDILFKLYSDNPDHHELKEIILYRGIAKAASTLRSYRESYDRYRKCIDTSYNVLATQGMGRSSSGEKGSTAQNCQNVSNYLTSHEHFGLKPIRSFMKPRPGYVLAEIDLDASHAQFARYLSQDTNLQRSKNEGIKLHYFTLSSMFKMQGKSYSPEDCILLVSGKLDVGNHTVYKRLYKLSKNVFYSFLNYSGAGTLQNTFFKEEVFVSYDECKLYLVACAEAFEELRIFQDQIYSKAMKTKMRLSSRLGDSLGMFVYTKPCDGSTLYYRGMRQQKYGQWGYYWKISDIISGQWLRPEATVMKTALGDIASYKVETDLDFRLVNFSHDSVIIEVHESVIDPVIPHCFELMNNSMRRFIPDYEPESGWQSTIKKESWAK